MPIRTRHRIVSFTCSVLLIALATGCRSSQPDAELVNFAEARRLGREAYGKQDYAAAANYFREAHRAVPDHPSVLFNVAAMETLAGNREDAIRALEQLAALDLYLGVGGEETFAPLREDPRFVAVVSRLESSRDASIATSAPLVRFTGRGLIPEGLALDERTGAFFVSSVRERKVLKVTREGSATEFASSDSGLWSGMGMRADSANRILWVATSAGPQMEGFVETDRGAAAVIKFDLDSGRVLKRYDVERGARQENDGSEGKSPEHWFGDLALASDGSVFITDSTQPEIYRIDPKTDRLELLITDPRFQSLQGVDVSADGGSLFVTDYSTGLYRIDLRSKRVSHLASPPGASLIGIDGVYRCGDDLLGIQNGINPNRLIRIELASPDRVRRVDAIDRKHPQYNEPTLGVVTGSRFAYIANSQWGALDKENRLPAADQLEDPIILGFDAGCR